MKNTFSGGFRVLRYAAWTSAFVLVASCNVFSPFEGSGSDLDHLELGQKYIAEGRYDDSIAEFGQISDATTRNDWLCTANISKAGFTLSTLVNSLTGTSISILGGVANKLMPWTQAKQDAADAAKVACVAYSTLAAGTNAKAAVLLRTLADIVHCATLMAKTDQFVTTDGTTCTAAGQNNGSIGPTDVGGDGAGAVSVGTPGMCTADVNACLADLTDTNPTTLGNQGLADLKDVYDGLPADLKNSGTSTQAARVALRSTL